VRGDMSQTRHALYATAHNSLRKAGLPEE